MSDSTFYRNNSPDTSNMVVWNLLYEEMYYSAHDTTWMTPLQDIEEYSNQFYGDTILISLMDYDIYHCVPNSLTTGDYFTFDTTNDQLQDHPNPIGSPYGQSNIFAAAAMKESSYFSDPVFRIDPNMFFTDNINAPLYDNQESVRIDFGDGTGWHYYDMGQVSHHHAYYPEAGRKVVEVQLYNKKTHQVVKSSISSFNVVKNKSAEPADEYLMDFPGIDVGVYHACEDLNPEKRKVIIYIEGLDPLDFIASQGNSIEENYDKMINSKYIDELKNFNYSYYVVNFDKSTLDLRINAMHVLNLLEYLKNEYKDSDEQFVIMGHSMGGVIGRFLLTYMESEDYADGDYGPLEQGLTDPQSQSYLAQLLQEELTLQEIGDQNRNENLVGQMHKTRSLITLDSPHQGANVPLALQHSYKKLVHVLPTASIATTAFNILLDSKAAKQLLINHIDASPGAGLPNPMGAYFNYQEHPFRTSFMNQLANMGNYPQYCKLVALSSADMGGSNQTNFYNNLRVANDNIIDFEVDLKARILWMPRSIGVIRFNLRTNPNGTGLVFHASKGEYSYSFDVYWFGIGIQSNYTSSFEDNQYAVGVKPYCTRTAGYYQPTDDKNFMSSWALNQSNLSGYYLFNLASWNTTLNNGCFDVAGHVGWNGFASINLDMDICSNGLHFGFVPLQSALDYGNGLNLPINHDIENEGINTKLSRTPFDLMIGYTDGENHDHSKDYYDPLIYNVTGDTATRCDSIGGLNYEYAYYDADLGLNCEVKRSLLCLEIGDEQMYLENWTLNRNATFQTQYDLLVNERNPYYEYPSTITNMPPEYQGLYSKENPFLISPSGYSLFITNPSASPSGIGFLYNNNFSGDWDFDEQFMNVCVEDYAQGKSYSFDADTLSPEKQVYAKLFPNPNNGESVMLAYDFLSDEQVNIQIFEVTGKIALELSNLKGGMNEKHLELSNLDKGMYLVNVFTVSERQTIRLIIH